MKNPKVRFAILASLAKLLTEEINDNSGLMQELPRPVTPSLHLLNSATLYLWTFTTPDVVNLSVLAGRWHKFCGSRRFRRLNVKWMRVFEPHATHGYHVHCVGVRRFDVMKIRPLALKYGFGRMNVSIIPGNKASYVTKYLNKHQRRLGEKSVRMWATVGFKGYSVSEIRIEDTWTRWIYRNVVGVKDAKKYPWHMLVGDAIALKCGTGSIQSRRVLHMTKAQEVKAIELLNRGAKLCIVEFRTSEVREAKKYVNGVPSVSEKTYYHQLFCETAAKPLLVEELLPDSYRPGDKLSAPMKKGQTAIFEQSKVRVFNGVTTYEGQFHEVS